MFLVFLGVFRVLGAVPGFGGCSWFFGCSGMFRNVPVFRVPVFLEVLHASSMWTFALLRDSSDLHIYKDLGSIFGIIFDRWASELDSCSPYSNSNSSTISNRTRITELDLTKIHRAR